MLLFYHPLVRLMHGLRYVLFYYSLQLGKRSLASCLGGGDVDGYVALLSLRAKRTTHSYILVINLPSFSTSRYCLPAAMKLQNILLERRSSSTGTALLKIYVISSSNTSGLMFWYVVFMTKTVKLSVTSTFKGLLSDRLLVIAGMTSFVVNMIIY